MLAVPEIPESYEQRLRIGTCSWKYDSWKGLVYDEDRDYGPYDYLVDYARYFNTVEVDQWFWSLFVPGAKLPSSDAVKGYADSVPDDFRFGIKAPNSITLTHYYARQPRGSESHANKPNPHFLDTDLLNRFLETLGPMQDKLGPVMFQFEYLNKKKMPSLRAFIDELDAFFERAPKGFMYAVESRNPDYLCKDFFGFLRQRQIGCVLLDGYYMPPIAKVAGIFDVRTAEFSVIRLHGPDRAKVEEQTGGIWNQIVAPKDHGLEATAELIRENTEEGVSTYVNVNNHYEGSAPLTIQRLVDAL